MGISEKPQPNRIGDSNKKERDHLGLLIGAKV